MLYHSIKGIVFNIQKFSLHDGPGIRTIIFLKGCPLQCLWCCNPESQSIKIEIGYNLNKCIQCKRCFSVCPTSALQLNRGKRIYNKDICKLCGKCVEECPTNALTIFGKSITIERVMEEILKDIDFYQVSGGGVTLSGGEPLLQLDFATIILEECKKKEINTVVETCGYVNWEIIKKISIYVDLFLFDIKLINSKKHKMITGKDNKLILENLQKLSSLYKPIVIRITIVPGYNDEIEDIKEVAKFLRKLKNIKYVEFMPYHDLGIYKYNMLGRDYYLKSVSKPSKKSLYKFKSVFMSCNIKVKDSSAKD